MPRDSLDSQLGTEYDPDQDPEEKRNLRRQYRNLYKSTTEDAQGHAKDLTADQLVEKVKQSDSLFHRVKGTAEATLDSTFLLAATQMGAAKARAMKAGAGAFDVDDFVSRLITYMGRNQGVAVPEDLDSDEEQDYNGELLDYARIGRRALAKSRRIPVMDFMLGPLSIEQKKRAVTKRATLQKDEREKRKPQEITEGDITRSENETTKNVATLERVLQQQESRVNLFRVISVENLFYLSFLIRDGKCALEFDDGEPFIYVTEQPSEEDYAQGLRKQQLVMEFDMATWRRAIEVFDIKDALIPQRPKSTLRIGGKWYG
ncbi:binding domain of Nse4/EID3 to Nse3-MAGE-domain-containing protein [Fomitopsis serialis]|uniref:binding domain of Nse4/EID3 to Nse3-MAGE-domain-containing protein n=1 Tax=Fomitopsis serialis TaxID=139415 RepID=UPI0020082719|nr:binding domain of Nse4/EID3 to Nse3-MAGE-domain-containing protein [Neoantrodia serialis]KAH9916528.1 binding domain of Nse4/EID3 to Nse3-MAGE-domain-containing protein [Neoantrodia serialis]